MFSKLGQGLVDGRVGPSRLATLSMVIVTSVFKADCHG
jgi:hypothetical protein